MEQLSLNEELNILLCIRYDEMIIINLTENVYYAISDEHLAASFEDINRTYCEKNGQHVPILNANNEKNDVFFTNRQMSKKFEFFTLKSLVENRLNIHDDRHLNYNLLKIYPKLSDSPTEDELNRVVDVIKSIFWKSLKNTMARNVFRKSKRIRHLEEVLFSACIPTVKKTVTKKRIRSGKLKFCKKLRNVDIAGN